MKAPSSFQTVQEVIGIQNSILSIISGGTRTGVNDQDFDLIGIIKQKELTELAELQRQLETLENNLLISLGVEDFNELYRKTQEWKNSGASAILQDASLIEKIQLEIDQAREANLLMAVEKFQNQALTREQMIDLFGEEIDGLISSVPTIISGGIRGGSGSRAGTISISFQSNTIADKKSYTKSEVIKGMTIFQRGKTSKSKGPNVEIHFTQNISSSNQAKLTEKMTKILRDSGQQVKLVTRSDTYEAIKDRILSYLPSGGNGYTKAREAIDRVITHFLIDEYDIKMGRNSSVVRGALGEIYWAAFFDFINVPAVPVGLTAKTTNNKEIPVDILFEEFGFQVKNYTMKDGVVTFNQHFSKEVQEMVPNQIPFDKFFANTLELGASASEAIGKFYFSKNYNLRNEKIDKEGKYSPVEARFAPIEQGIISYIKANQDKLLNLNRNVLLKTPELFNENFNPGRPILFLINETPLLASAMVQEIINQLSPNFNDLVYINIKGLEVNSHSFQTSKHWDQSVEPNIAGRLKGSYVSYTIDVNVSGLIDKILKQ